MSAITKSIGNLLVSYPVDSKLIKYSNFIFVIGLVVQVAKMISLNNEYKKYENSPLGEKALRIGREKMLLCERNSSVFIDRVSMIMGISMLATGSSLLGIPLLITGLASFVIRLIALPKI